MPVLHNRVSQKELKERLYRETEPRTTLSFYRYTPIADPGKFRDALYIALNELGVFGRIYIAAEGINAQISVPASRLDALKACLDSIACLNEPCLNESRPDEPRRDEPSLNEPGPNEQDFNVPDPDVPIPNKPRLDQPPPNELDPDAPELNDQHANDSNLHNSALKNLRLNIAVDDDGKSFWVLKIKLRDKIVADGIGDPAFTMERKGKYVDAEAFNRLTEQPDTVVVDMRNHYEYEVGHFEGAIEIPSDTFREQLPLSAEMLQKDKERNIIMYCTGGIRCEKASAYLLHKGFKNVFHLEGGIIHYAHTVKEKGLENKFKGKNFVFDDRLGERISEEVIARCHQCGQPADTHTNCRNEGCHLLFIQCAACAASYEGCCSTACREIIRLPVEEQKKIRKGVVKDRQVFNKSKGRRGGL